MTAQVAEKPKSQEVMPANNAAPGTVAYAESEKLLGMIGRLASDPNTNVENLERMMAMYERQRDYNAKNAYFAAIAEMKPKLPVIDRKGRIEVREKDAHGKRTGDLVQSTSYAKWEHIDEAITPILTTHGFALTFKTGVAQDGKITVTGILAHNGGHSEETTITLPHDSTGSKNAVQAVGSSTSYGKRYTATLLLNIRTKGEDDDGKAGGAEATINEDQLAQIQHLIDESKADVQRFCERMNVPSLKDIKQKDFKAALAIIEERNKKLRAKSS